MNADIILEARDLTQAYPDGDGGVLTVLNGVSFTLEGGRTCAVIGPSGSGKTTLLGLCAGLDKPSRGEVLLCGEVLGHLNEDARARLRNRHVGFIFQNFQLLSTLTALENVVVPAELQGRGNAQAEGKKLLEQVGLGDRLHHYPIQLSGGEQQRVAVARSFMNNPKILFADEPTGNLDTETSHRVLEVLFDLNNSRGTALVLVTHDPELASRMERTIRLRGGEIVEDTQSSMPLRNPL